MGDPMAVPNTGKHQDSRFMPSEAGSGWWSVRLFITGMVPSIVRLTTFTCKLSHDSQFPGWNQQKSKWWHLKTIVAPKNHLSRLSRGLNFWIFQPTTRPVAMGIWKSLMSFQGCPNTHMRMRIYVHLKESSMEISPNGWICGKNDVDGNGKISHRWWV